MKSYHRPVYHVLAVLTGGHLPHSWNALVVQREVEVVGVALDNYKYHDVYLRFQCAHDDEDVHETNGSGHDHDDHELCENVADGHTKWAARWVAREVSFVSEVVAEPLEG